MCTSSTTAFVPTNTTAPAPTAANTTTLTCSTTTAALTGGPSSGVTYQWTGAGFSGGTTSQNATATLPGTYTLTVTNPVNSCTAIATTAVTQNTLIVRLNGLPRSSDRVQPESPPNPPAPALRTGPPVLRGHGFHLPGGDTTWLKSR